MQDTLDIRQKMLALWTRFDKGGIKAPDARVHIGFARTVLDSLKVDIAAAHLAAATIPPVRLSGRPKLIEAKRRKKAA